MRSALLTLAVSGIIHLSCSAQNTTLHGTILAPKSDSVAVWHVRTEGKRQVQTMLAEGPLDKKGHFNLRFDLDSARTLVFSDGNEVTKLYMLPKESLGITLHTAYFDETIRYTGDGSARNNALASLALASEIDMLSSKLYAHERGADSAAISQLVEERLTEINRMTDDLATTYPEMAGLLSERKAENIATATRSNRAIRESVHFSTLRRESKGQPLKDIAGVNAAGDTIHLSQFKGKTTVVDFWATWCGPCQLEMPSWAELEKQYGDQVNFVSISVWDNKEKWKARTAELGHTNSLFISKENLGQLAPYAVSSIPRYMVIDKDLKIVTIDAPRPSSPELVKLF